VETIRASGHVRRDNRLNTRLLLTNLIAEKGLAKREPSTQDKAALRNRNPVSTSVCHWPERK